MYLDLVGKDRIYHSDFLFLDLQVGLLITHIYGKTGYLNIEVYDLLLGSKQFEIAIHSKTTSWCCPGPFVNVLPCVMQEISQTGTLIQQPPPN